MSERSRESRGSGEAAERASYSTLKSGLCACIHVREGSSLGKIDPPQRDPPSFLPNFFFQNRAVILEENKYPERRCAAATRWGVPLRERLERWLAEWGREGPRRAEKGREGPRDGGDTDFTK